VNGVGEGAVPEDVHEAADDEEKRDDPRHPSERHDRCQKSTRAENVAPSKISPLLGDDSGSNDPQDKDGQESNQFAAKG